MPRLSRRACLFAAGRKAGLAIECLGRQGTSTKKMCPFTCQLAGRRNRRRSRPPPPGCEATDDRACRAGVREADVALVVGPGAQVERIARFELAGIVHRDRAEVRTAAAQVAKATCRHRAASVPGLASFPFVAT